MNNRIIYPNTEGGVAVVVISGAVPIEQVIETTVPKGRPYKIVDVSEIPEDREFRYAWEFVNDNIEINFDIAKEITKHRLREERKPLLAQQDVEFLKAIEINKDTTEIIKEKNRLRDITKLADAASNLSELKRLHAEKPRPDAIPEKLYYM